MCKVAKWLRQHSHPTRQVFVSNIPYSYGEQDIIAAFDNLQITKVQVVTTNLGRSRGFCFVDLANKVCGPRCW